MKSLEAQKAIEVAFPNLPIIRVEYLDEGMDSAAFFVNQEYIFRFAKREKNSGKGRGLRVEVKLLPYLERQVKVMIPHFEFVGTQPNGLPFVGYRKIPGKPLSKELLDSLTGLERREVFEEISLFFQTIHRFPLELAKECGVKEKDFKAEYASDLEKVKRQVYPLLDSEQQGYLSGLLEDYLAESDNFTYNPSLLHADLWLEHIFYDEEQRKITGIIDFGDVIIGDPDYDFMQIYQKYGDRALDYFSEFMPGFERERVKRKALFFQKWNVVQDLMFFQEIGDQAGVKDGLKEVGDLSNYA